MPGSRFGPLCLYCNWFRQVRVVFLPSRFDTRNLQMPDRNVGDACGHSHAPDIARQPLVPIKSTIVTESGDRSRRKSAGHVVFAWLVRRIVIARMKKASASLSLPRPGNFAVRQRLRSPFVTFGKKNQPLSAAPGRLMRHCSRLGRLWKLASMVGKPNRGSREVQP